MNRSLAIAFKPGGAIALSLAEEVKGFQCTVQNALVNLLTDEGSDMIFPTRGTGLFKSALNSAIFNFRSASHVCNFAASETLFFGREHEVAVSGHKMSRINLDPVFLNLSRMDVQAGFLSIDGENISFKIEN